MKQLGSIVPERVLRGLFAAINNTTSKVGTDMAPPSLQYVPTAPQPHRLGVVAPNRQQSRADAAVSLEPARKLRHAERKSNVNEKVTVSTLAMSPASAAAEERVEQRREELQREFPSSYGFPTRRDASLNYTARPDKRGQTKLVWRKK